MKATRKQIFALIYRTAAFFAVLTLILLAEGVLDGDFMPNKLLYYTHQSNILVLIWFGVAAFKTLRGLKKSERVAFYPRINAIILLAILTTLVVFWGAIAPVADKGNIELWTLSNLGVHLINPLICLIDYILFSEGGHITARDPWYATLIPIFYVLQATILGHAGVNYQTVKGGPYIRFPYFFIDWNISVPFVFAWVIVIFGVFIAGASIMLYIDRWRSSIKKMAAISEQSILQETERRQLETRQRKERAERRLIFILDRRKWFYIVFSSLMLAAMFLPVLRSIDAETPIGVVDQAMDRSFIGYEVSFIQFLSVNSDFNNPLFAVIFIPCGFLIPLAILIFNIVTLKKKRVYVKVNALLFLIQAAILLILYSGIMNTFLELMYVDMFETRSVPLNSVYFQTGIGAVLGGIIALFGATLVLFAHLMDKYSNYGSVADVLTRHDD